MTSDDKAKLMRLAEHYGFSRIVSELAIQLGGEAVAQRHAIRTLIGEAIVGLSAAAGKLTEAELAEENDRRETYDDSRILYTNRRL